jgi:PAS domain S-box-containing protein
MPSTPDPPIRVLVAEDEPPLRAAICDLLAGETGIEIVDAVGDAPAAIERAEALRPDVAILDVRMPGGGPAAARGIREQSPNTKVVALSAYDDQATVLGMFRAGAIAYLVKGVAAEEIVEAIRRAARGQASLSVGVIRGVASELASDAVERSRDEEVLRQSEADFRALLEAAPDGVVIVDAQGTIALVNDQTERLFGYGRKELLGKPIETLLPERARSRHVKHRDGYRADPRTRPMGVGLDLAGLRKDGSEFPVDISLATVATDEGPLVIAFVRDVTARGAQEQLERDRAERRRLLGHLVAVEEERARIAGNIHDDSIQAITAAGMRLQILRRRLDDPEQLKLLGELQETIQLSIGRLRRLLFELRPPALDHDGLSSAVALYLEQEEQDSDTRYRLDDRLRSQPPHETRTMLYRIVQEALTNVRKHAHAQQATVGLRESDGGYLVRVDDNGIGFDVEQGAQPTPGHLGLAAMHERATLVGGWLRIESAPGEGTTIEVWTPRTLEPDTRTAPPPD